MCKKFKSIFLWILRVAKKAFSFLWKWTRRTLYVAAALVIMICGLLLSADYILMYAINHSARYVDLNAKVEDVYLHLFTQRIILKNISLQNPDGFPDNEAFSASKVTLKFDFFDLANPLRRVYIQNAKVRVEGRSGRRIMAKSFLRSNTYVIAREIARTFDVKLEQKLLPRKEEKKLEEKPFDYALFREKMKEFDSIDEIRLENVTIQNGDDLYSFGSLTYHDSLISIGDFKSTIFGVRSRIRNAFCDLKNPAAGFAGFAVYNPEGYPKNSAFSIKRFLIKSRDKKLPDGRVALELERVDVDSPQLRFEDKNGSMLGAIGMDNNFAGILNTINSMSHAKLNDLFQDEFESVPESQEFKLPEIALDNISITNARIVCGKKDMGLLANSIKVKKNLIEIDDVRAHVGGLKLELEGIDLDTQKQLFTATNFELKNPAGFPEENAFRFKNFTMSTNLSEKVLRGNRVMQIDKISVSNFFVRLDSRSGSIYDLIGNDNNLYGILDSIAKTTEAMPVYQASIQSKINENLERRPYKYIIKSVNFSGGKIFIGPRGDSIKIPFNDVNKTDLGVEEKGLTSQEATTLILKEIIINSIDGAQDKVSEEIGGILLAPVITVLRALITLF